MDAIAKDTRYTLNGSMRDDGTVIMLLYDNIGYNEKTGKGIRGSWFAEEMYYHSKNGYKVCVYINSPGGSVYDGFNMVQAIVDCNADTHIVGMAASMAGVISQFGVKRTMNDFAIGMVHAVSGNDDKLGMITQAQLIECLKKRSKLTTKQINAMMADGNDEWLDSSDMFEMGLVDEVIVTGKKPKTNFLEKKSPTGNGKFLNVNETFKIYSQIVNELTFTPTPTDMEDIKLVGTELGIENANKDAVIAKVKELKTSAANSAELKTKLDAAEAAKLASETAKTDLENKIKKAEDDLKIERKSRSTELIENAIASGKIKEELKADYIAMAETNYDLAKKTLGGITVAGGKHTSVRNEAGNTGGDLVITEDYETLARTNPEKFNKLQEEQPEKFKQLETAYLNKQKQSK